MKLLINCVNCTKNDLSGKNTKAKNNPFGPGIRHIRGMFPINVILLCSSIFSLVVDVAFAFSLPTLPSNVAISSQMTMKLGKDVLWVEIFTN